MIKKLIIDAAMWALLVAGFFMQVPYLEALAPFVFWCLSLLLLFVGFSFSFMPEHALRLMTLKSPPGRSVILWRISTAAKIGAIASIGHYWLAGVMLFGWVMVMAGADRVTEVRAAGGSGAGEREEGNV